MPASAAQRCHNEEDRRSRRLASYKRYRRKNLESCREKARARMARLRVSASEKGITRPNVAMPKSDYRETIAHRARWANVQKNLVQGKDTKLRPKARQYWSDIDLLTSDEEDGDNW
ncbi:hypothetical protein C8R45DRAFT_1095130 [Mycena sanguinolenta]|nr:hypothetical protein C8R45DRAFT_1095130 [Mycena sanguinolenta]